MLNTDGVVQREVVRGITSVDRILLHVNRQLVIYVLDCSVMTSEVDQ